MKIQSGHDGEPSVLKTSCWTRHAGMWSQWIYVACWKSSVQATADVYTRKLVGIKLWHAFFFFFFFFTVAYFAKSFPCRQALSEKDSPVGLPQMRHDPRWKDYLEEEQDGFFLHSIQKFCRKATFNGSCCSKCVCLLLALSV